MVVFVEIDGHFGRKAANKGEYPKGKTEVRGVGRRPPRIPYKGIYEPDDTAKRRGKHATGVSLEWFGERVDELEEGVQGEAGGQIEQKESLADGRVFRSAGQRHLGARRPADNAIVALDIWNKEE